MKLNKVMITMILMITMFTQCMPVYARHGGDGGGHHGGGRGGHHGGYNRGWGGRSWIPWTIAGVAMAAAASEYYYQQGRYYQVVNGQYVVIQAPYGATFSSVPGGGQYLQVNGDNYYLLNGVTYKVTPTGYVVVPPVINTIQVVSPAQH